MHVKGEFKIKLTPLYATLEEIDKQKYGRSKIDKQYSGDLTATGFGEMLTVRTSAPNSAGYVAVERIEGSIQGREGSFVVQHVGIFNRGVGTLHIDIVPDSGTGDFVSIAGKMSIRNEGERHYYDLEYSLP
ncbi:DUF3224 domain-containing protein [bacterium]|nr:DUF3224 domain-containing protein [candidate division CSSED10-310 bacterium]